MKSIVPSAVFAFIGIILFFVAYKVAGAEVWMTAPSGPAMNHIAGPASFGFSIAGGMALIASALVFRNPQPPNQ